eukprot:39624-Eustigmatos_ZCMA.PRE.1
MGVSDQKQHFHRLDPSGTSQAFASYGWCSVQLYLLPVLTNKDSRYILDCRAPLLLCLLTPCLCLYCASHTQRGHYLIDPLYLAAAAQVKSSQVKVRYMTFMLASCRLLLVGLVSDFPCHWTLSIGVCRCHVSNLPWFDK